MRIPKYGHGTCVLSSVVVAPYYSIIILYNMYEYYLVYIIIFHICGCRMARHIAYTLIEAERRRGIFYLNNNYIYHRSIRVLFNYNIINY